MAGWRLGIVAAVLMLVAVTPLTAQNDHEVLRDKVLVVYLKSDPKVGAVLEKVAVQSLGNRYFLVGSVVDLGDSTVAGMIQWIPIDDIGRINQLNDVTELRTRMRAP